MRVTVLPRKTWRLQTIALLLIAAFLYVQWAFAQHQTDLQKHQPHHQCEGCLAVGHVGDALADTPSHAADSQSHVYLQENLRAEHGGETHLPYGARAPPATLHI